MDVSTQYTASVYIYPEEARDYQIRVLDQDSNLINSEDTGALTADTWQRIDNTFTTGADDTGIIIQVRKNNHANTDVYYVDAVMVENGATASAWKAYTTGPKSQLFYLS